MRGRTLREVFRVLLVPTCTAGLFGCDFSAIKECHSEMGVSQQMMIDFSQGDRENLEQAEGTLAAVERTLAACRKAKRTEEVEKITDAHRQLSAHVKSLKERAEREKRPKLSEEELVELKKKGDPSCPKGQEYEHFQNGEVIKCTGPQMHEMNASQASEYFSRRGFLKTAEKNRLRFERGAQVIDFHYLSATLEGLPACLSIVADPGISWQETVARATGTNPLRLELGKPISTKSGARELLVEGGPHQFTVKIGKCEPTPGQKPVTEEPAQEP